MHALLEADVDCPYCGARFTTVIDSSSGDCDYIEDCAVCCQPIEFHLRINEDGPQIVTTRGDESY